MRLLSIVLLAALTAACATTPDQLPRDRGWAQHHRDLSALEHWQVEGKLALRSAGQAESARLLWRQDAGNSHLQLSGPLGLNTTVIDSDGTQLLLRRGDEVRRLDISSPEAIARNTGWDLPLQALPYWLKGLPVPDREVSAVESDQSLLRRFSQDGWQIVYQRYQQFGDLLLPVRLEVSRGDTSARLVIRQWTALAG